MAVKWDPAHQYLLPADQLKTSFGVSCEDRCSPTFLERDTVNGSVVCAHCSMGLDLAFFTLCPVRRTGPGVKDIQNTTQAILYYASASDFNLPSQFYQAAGREGD